MGITNSIKSLTDQDYELILTKIYEAEKQVDKDQDEPTKELSEYREHLRLQHEIADWGLRHKYRVHVATNDKVSIKEKLNEVLDEIPKFHREDIVNIAKRIDVLFFEQERDILTHAFEVEHTTTIYSGLLRLNDIAESYRAENVKFFIVSKGENRDRFEREIQRPSFNLLRKYNCQFRDYEQVEEEWIELQKRKPSIF